MKCKDPVLKLRMTKEQTPEICLEAVKQYGLALQYVKEQTPEICLKAIKNDGNAFTICQRTDIRDMSRSC